jgi:polysaccharide pyruvyl transferase WcaK-like protein/MoaA/NifB/PqqE/SkfB family radical SAM enzyme
VVLYRDTRPLPNLRKPEVVQFPVNDICNSRCQMCFIWQQKKAKELSPAEVARVFADPLFDRVKGVGINGGEPTLRKDLAELVRAAAGALPRLKHVSLITNAIQRDRVLDRIREIRTVTNQHGLSFDVMISLDGVGQMHDLVRGKPGNFTNAVYVLDAVRAENLATSLRIGCTITETNVAAGEELLEWAIERDVYARFRVAVAHNRLYNRDCQDDYEVRRDQLFPLLMLLDRLSREYEPERRRRGFYRSLLEQLAYDQPRSAGCAWRNHGITLLANGELAYCAVESPELGNALEESPTNVYWANDHIRRDILENKCADCRHDYDGPGDFSEEMVDLARALPLAGRVGRVLSPHVRSTYETWATAKELMRGASHSRRRPSSLKRRGDTLILTGWYGTETIGDQAILAGILSLARAVHDGPVAVSSLEPFITERTLSVMGLRDYASTVSYSESLSMITSGKARAVAMAGGPLMGTIPQIRLLAQLHSEASRLGVSTGMLGIGVGPLGKNLPTRLIKQILRRSEVVITRDEQSAQLAADLGCDAVSSAADPALIWLGRPAVSPSTLARTDRALALAIRSWPIHEYGAGRFTPTMRSRFEDTLRIEIKSLETSFRIVPVAMGTVHVGGDDRRILRDLLGPESSPLTALTEFPTPESVKESLLGCDYTVAMRYHAALFSVALGLPTVAIDYTGGGKLGALRTQFPQVIGIDPVSLSPGDLESAVADARPVPTSEVDRMRRHTSEAMRTGLRHLLG